MFGQLLIGRLIESSRDRESAHVTVSVSSIRRNVNSRECERQRRRERDRERQRERETQRTKIANDRWQVHRQSQVGLGFSKKITSGELSNECFFDNPWFFCTTVPSEQTIIGYS